MEQGNDGEQPGLLNPAEETACRIDSQALRLMQFCASSVMLSLYTALTSEAGLHESGRLWSIWMTFLALPLKYLMYIAAMVLLTLAVWGLLDPQRLRGDVRPTVVTIVLASICLLTNLAGWIAWIVMSLLQLPFLLGTVAAALGGTYWWFTQPNRLNKRREYELAGPLDAADELRVRLFEANLGDFAALVQFRTRHEMRDHMILAETRPWVFALHTALHLLFGQ